MCLQEKALSYSFQFSNITDCPLQDFLALIDQLPKIEAGSWMELRHLGGAAARARRCGAAGSRAASAPLQPT